MAVGNLKVLQEAEEDGAERRTERNKERMRMFIAKLNY
jgi:hypothetical protein